MSEPDIEELERRCQIEGLAVDDATSEFEDDEGRVIGQHHGWFVSSQAGEFSGSAHLRHEEDVEFALSTQFEKWRPIDGYEAMWSPTGRIEAELVGRDRRGVLADKHPLETLVRRLGVTCPKNLRDLCIPIPTPSGGPRISLGYSSSELHVWRTVSPAVHLISNGLLPVMRLVGSRARDQYQALEQLESWGHAALLELDTCTGVPLRFRTHYPFRIHFPLTRSRRAIREVTLSPETTPTRLYLHARQVDSGNAAARFLGYYQVLEYYFPRYSIQAEVDRLRGELGFAGVADDVLVDIVRNTHHPMGIGREAKQFEQLLAAVTPGDELRALIQADPLLANFYAQASMPLVDKRISACNPQSNLPKQVADRLYRIRCRIVHTKEQEGDEVFVPFAAEAADLYADTRLLGELARRVLVATGRDL